MQPSGNTRYDPATAWTPEDEPRSQQLLEPLSTRFTQFLEIYLDEIVGDAYVRFAKGKEPTQIPQPQAERAPQSIRHVSNAPPPPTEVRGSGWRPPSPKATHPLVDFPMNYPTHLMPQTTVIIGQAVKKFPVQPQTLDLLKYVTSELTPHFCAAVQNKTLRADLALSRMGDLVHSLSVYNCDDQSATFRLEQEVRKSDEWLKFAGEIAKGSLVTDGNAPSPKSIEPSARGGPQSSQAKATSWDAVEISFLSDERVQIRNGAARETLNY